MKRLLSIVLGLAAVVAVGAGCQKKAIEGDWFLAFDLPREWVMVAPYDPESAAPLDHDLTIDDAEVVLQNVDAKIMPGEGEAATDVVRKDYAKVSVTRYDRGRKAPDGAVNVGGGLVKDESASKPTYYLTVGEFLYKATVETDGTPLADIEKILSSAKEVRSAGTK